MKNLVALGIVSATVTLILLSGCSSASSQTHRIVDTSIAMHKIFVFSQLGGKKRSPFSDGFMETITKNLRACGYEVKADNISQTAGSLSLNNDPTDGVNSEIQSFAPDYVLRVTQQATTIMGTSIGANTNVALTRYPDNQPIWNGTVSSSGSFGIGAASSLADEITNKLHKDNVLQNCLANGD